MKTAGARRGTAIPETALMIGFTMLVLFGAVRLTVATYVQAQTDASAFVGAHTVAQNPQGSTSADQSYAARVIAGIFPHVPPGAIGVARSGSTVTATVSQSADGLAVPGAPSTITLNSHVTEPVAQATPGSLPPYTYGVEDELENYCPTPAVPYATPTLCWTQESPDIYIAQNLSYQGSGANGVNGQFSEWVCHAKDYAAVNWPAKRPQGGAGSRWDPTSPQSPLNPIYAWDTGNHTCT